MFDISSTNSIARSFLFFRLNVFSLPSPQNKVIEFVSASIPSVKLTLFAAITDNFFSFSFFKAFSFNSLVSAAKPIEKTL